MTASVIKRYSRPPGAAPMWRRERCPAALRSDVEAYAELVRAGRTPGDELRERARVHGPLRVLEEVARCVRRPPAAWRHARARTLTLTDFDDAELTAQHSPLMSPLVWDLAHIGPAGGSLAAAWRQRAARACCRPRSTGSTTHSVPPARDRVDLPLLSPVEARRFIADVRGRAFDQLDRAGRDLFPFAMVEQHEHQHVETMFATHQLRDGPPLLGRGSALPPGAPGTARLPCWSRPATFALGRRRRLRAVVARQRTSRATVVDLPAFRIGRVPVTNAEWQAFIDDGGYDRAQWWSPRGWAHRVDHDLTRPLFWSA